jgi:hypothetical protein
MIFLFDHLLLNHPVALFLVALVILTLASQAGFRLRGGFAASNQDVLQEQVKEARDGIVFLLSLLLGFTLAMAMTRFDQRKGLLVDEANDIGTTSLRASLLPEPYGSQMTRLVADYARARLAYFQAGNDAKSIDAALAQTKQLQSQIWELTRDAARAAPTPITSSFIQSLNETIDVTEKQIAGVENRIPFSVWLMILIIAILACLVSGVAVRRRVLFSLVLTPFMAAVVMSLTADLDSPRTGLIQVGISSMERVCADLHSPSSVKAK